MSAVWQIFGKRNPFPKATAASIVRSRSLDKKASSIKGPRPADKRIEAGKKLEIFTNTLERIELTKEQEDTEEIKVWGFEPDKELVVKLFTKNVDNKDLDSFQL